MTQYVVVGFSCLSSAQPLPGFNALSNHRCTTSIDMRPTQNIQHWTVLPICIILYRCSGDPRSIYNTLNISTVSRTFQPDTSSFLTSIMVYSLGGVPLWEKCPVCQWCPHLRGGEKCQRCPQQVVVSASLYTDACCVSSEPEPLV